VTVPYHRALPMQHLDVLEQIQQRRELRFDRLLDYLPRVVPHQFVHAETDFR
jgi:hypothetical protein